MENSDRWNSLKRSEQVEIKKKKKSQLNYHAYYEIIIFNLQLVSACSRHSGVPVIHKKKQQPLIVVPPTHMHSHTTKVIYYYKTPKTIDLQNAHLGHFEALPGFTFVMLEITQEEKW